MVCDVRIHSVTPVSLIFMYHVCRGDRLAARPSLDILSVNKSLLCFLHISHIFWTRIDAISYSCLVSSFLKTGDLFLAGAQALISRKP